MAIYTKTGDKGQTSLFGGKRVPKYDAQVEAYGAIDEATCFIGSAYESIQEKHTREILTKIQHGLYNIMAYLAGAQLKQQELEEHIPLLETEIDHLDKNLPKLTRFILPQGSEATARLHIARAMIRSAERRVIYYEAQKDGEMSADDAMVIKYLNRLSDLFFMLARKFSNDEKVT